MRRSGLILAASLAAALAGCTKSDTNQQAEGAQAAATEQPAVPGATTPATSEADKQKLLAALPAPYNAADLANGEAKFALCRSCHTLQPGGANMTGPNLHGVFGRKAGQVEKFKYSDVLLESGIVWDAQHLDQWLANPRTYLPGTKMTFAGLKDAKDRTDLIAYLMVETGYQPK